MDKVGICIFFCIIIFSIVIDSHRKQVNLLMSLFGQFNNGDTYKDLKYWIDFNTFDEELQQLDDIKVRKLYDFCQFFNVLISFVNKFRLLKEEVSFVFKPYLKAMKENEICKNFIVEKGFIKLDEFLSKNEF